MNFPWFNFFELARPGWEMEMVTVEFKIIAAGLLLLLSIIFGIWLSNLGRPLNTFIFSIHKLLALATVIFAGIVVYNLHNNLEINAISIILIVLMAIFFLALFVTGIFLSFEKPLPGSILIIHKIVSALTLLVAIISVYLRVS